MNVRSLFVCLASIAALVSGSAAQTILPPASSADTSVRASVGINLSNFATQSQVSTLQTTVMNVDNRVTAVQNLAGQAQSSPWSWARYWAGTTRETGSSSSGVSTVSRYRASIGPDGYIAIWRDRYRNGNWELILGSYTSGTLPVGMSFGNPGGWVYDTGVSVSPSGWSSDGNATDWVLSVTTGSNK